MHRNLQEGRWWWLWAPGGMSLGKGGQGPGIGREGKMVCSTYGFWCQRQVGISPALVFSIQGREGHLARMPLGQLCGPPGEMGHAHDAPGRLPMMEGNKSIGHSNVLRGGSIPTSPTPTYLSTAMATSVKTEAETDMPCTRPLILHMVLSKGQPARGHRGGCKCLWLIWVHRQLPPRCPHPPCCCWGMLNPAPKRGLHFWLIQRWPLVVQMLGEKLQNW